MEPQSDAARLFSVDGADGGIFSDVLDGTYFQPADEGLEDEFENARIRRVHIDAESPPAGQTIGDASIRSRTGVTVLGIRRGEMIISEVDAEMRMKADDVLVGVGSDDSHAELCSLLS